MRKNTGTFFRLGGRNRRLQQALCEQRERLYRIAWSWCHDSDLADDLVQETQAKALSKLDTLREEARFEVWVTQIMANLYRDQFRRVQPETGFEIDQVSDADSPEQAAHRRELVRRTRAAVQKLNDDHRQVLTLVDLAEFSYADTASILELPIGTVMSRLSRARQKLRALLEQQDITSSQVVPMRTRS